MKEASRWAYTFSKRVVSVIVGLFFVHIVFADIMVYIAGDLSALGQTTDNITNVTVICLGGYVFKAALENVFKIRGGDSERY